MRVSGFSFIRNALTYDYPIKEAVCSILPLCDEVVVAVGQSEDGTRQLIESLGPKVRILDTVWDDSLREGGRVLAQETDKALAAVDPGVAWALYIQGDEVLHEDSIEMVRKAMLRHKDDPSIDGLLFDYRHFYGSYDFVGSSPRWYRREVRAVRLRPDVHSYRDAQGFRKAGNRKLRVAHSGGVIHHYGWVKDPRAQQMKQETFNRLWHTDEWMQLNVAKREAFDYGEVDALERFTGRHPKVMEERISRLNWQFDHDPTRSRMTLKDRAKLFVEKLTGWRPGEYRNYEL